MSVIKRPHSDKGVAAKKPGKSLKPKDAATLIIVRQDGPKPRILMGKRHENHAFMPNLYVFPGGRIDKADSRVKPATPLHPDVEAKLLVRMRGKPSKGRAQALAMTAVRETFEETGLLLGQQMDISGKSAHADWNQFLETGMRANLAPLRYFARARTPTGRTRRFDSRFFVADAEHVPNLDSPIAVNSDELLQINWLTIAETEDLDLPWITRQVLNALETQISQPGGVAPGGPVMFQYQRGNSWHADTL